MTVLLASGENPVGGLVICKPGPDSWVHALACFSDEDYLADMNSKAIIYIECNYSRDTCFKGLFPNINVSSMRQHIHCHGRSWADSLTTFSILDYVSKTQCCRNGEGS